MLFQRIKNIWQLSKLNINDLKNQIVVTKPNISSQKAIIIETESEIEKLEAELKRENENK